MATTEHNPTPAGWWRFHLQAPAGTPSPLREAYEALAAALHAAESGDDVGELADAAAEACGRAEPQLVQAADLAHERALDALWRIVDGDHVVHLRTMARNVRHQVMGVVPLVPRPRPVVRAEPSPVEEAEVEPPPRAGGRPQNPQKAEIAEFVKNARDAGDSWPVAATKVFERFGVKYTADGLRAFLRTR